MYMAWYAHTPMYIHICVYTYMYMYMYICICTYMCIYIYVYVHVYMYMYMYMAWYAHTSMYIHVYICTCIKIHTEQKPLKTQHYIALPPEPLFYHVCPALQVVLVVRCKAKSARNHAQLPMIRLCELQ